MSALADAVIRGSACVAVVPYRGTVRLYRGKRFNRVFSEFTFFFTKKPAYALRVARNRKSRARGLNDL